MKFLKGFRTYITLALIFVLAGALELQHSCGVNPAELGESICKVVQNEWITKIIMALTPVAAWFRKQANS